MKDGTCRHFNGIQNTECRAGVNMRDVTGGENCGWVRRAPCLEENHQTGKCEHYELPTAADLAAQEAAFEAVMEKMRLAGPIIRELKAKHKGKNWDGQRACPACGGVLHLAISASNGHVHGMCETDGCLRWME